MATSNPGTAQRPNGPSSAALQASSSYTGGIAGVQPQYQVILDVEGDPEVTKNTVFPIVATLPERYHMNMSSQWTSPFAKNLLQAGADKLLGSNGGAIAGAVAGAVGISTKLKSESVQVWESSSPLSFSVDLIFVAKTNSVQDVKLKHLALMKLAAPSELSGGGGQILVQPGPVILGTGIKSGTRKISLAIGTYLFLDNIIINDVSSDISSICDEAGIPQHMVINIQVSSFYACYTTQDLDKAFKMASGG